MRTTLGLLLALVWSGPVFAQSAEVRAYVDRSRVAVGQAFVLSIDISGDNSIGPPDLPDISGFASLLGNSSSQQIQIVNGRTTITRTLQYTYRATTEGSHQIGPVSVAVGGRTYRTEPVAIEIVAADPNRPPTSGAPSAGSGAAGVAPEDLFIQARADREWVYPNQPVVVEYKIYTRVNVRSFNIEGLPAAPGFIAEEYPLPSSPVTSQEVFDGRQYTVATIRKLALFPATAGDKTISPMRVTTGVEVRTRSRDPFDSFFSLGSPFGRIVEQPLESNPLSVEVRPLPAPPPDDFTGVVGKLEVSATVDSTHIPTDNAVTLKVRIEGEGNLRSLTAPSISFPSDFETYAPDATEDTQWEGDRVTGRREFDYVIIPRAPGDKTIPGISLSYFDPRTESFRTVGTDPIELVVSGEPSTSGFVAAGNRSAVRALRTDIRFIQTDMPDFTPIGGRAGGPWLWAILVTPLMVLGGAAAVRRQRDRLEGDAAYARRRRATRRATRRLGAARARLDPATAGEFYGEAAKALTGFLGDVLNIHEAGYIRDEAIGALRERGVDAAVIDEYFACVDVCARMRFAPGGADRDEMQRFLDRAAQAMSALERGAS